MSTEIDKNVVYVTAENIEKYNRGEVTWEELLSTAENNASKEFAIITGKDKEETRKRAEDF